MKIKIITDSSCDLPIQYVDDNQDFLEVIGMPIQIGGVEHIDDLGRTFSQADFYNHLRNGIMPTTSQITVYRFIEAFERNLEADTAVIYIGLTSGMSGTFNSATLAKNIVLEERPSAQLFIADTLAASIGLGAIVVHVIKMIKSGKPALEIVAWVNENKLKTHHWFGVDDLNYLKNGGRISPTSAIVGNMLNVKPTLSVDHEGKLKPYGNVRGRKKSMTLLVSKIEQYYDPQSDSTILLGHGNCLEDARLLQDMIKAKFPGSPLMLTELSMTIASHVGPSMIAVAFLGSEREK